ncbi:MAG: hypothetical protein KCHDKBKB_01581 [Elusimicrobia bacterium]|nr:hypothetical protein [Elusimicrobiota bacterium]
MDRDYEGKPHDYSLYLAADQKIDKLKDHVSELFQKVHSEKERTDHLFNRLDFGVSKTGQENSAKITELAVKINNLEHELAVETSNNKHHERIIGRIMAGIFWVSFTGVMGGLVAMAYQILKARLLGG